MNTVDAAAGLSGQVIVDLTKKHTLFEWSAQGAVDPIPVAGAKGCWFWTPEGKRFLDFNSQLMCVNIGHGHERVVRAIQRQVETLAYANPFMATEPRARLGQKLAEITPGDIDTFFFTNGVLVPPDGYLQGVREFCTKHGILMIADEVMSGFGRTGEWFAVDNWRVVPDLLTMAKGLTSAYVPLGAVGMRHAIAEHFRDKVFFGGLTYNSHPLACATALATLQVYEEDGLIQNARRMGGIMKGLMDGLASRHAIVGATRAIGLFGIVELVKNRSSMEPLAPFNGTSEPMKRLGKFFREEGLYTFVRWNTFFTNPPLSISEEELRHGFGIIERGLSMLKNAEC